MQIESRLGHTTTGLEFAFGEMGIIMARFDAAVEMDGGHASFAMTADTLFQLGLRYSSGREVDVDLVTAHKWFNLATTRGHTAARTYRAEVAGDMTRGEIAKAQRMAREWLRGC